MNRRRFSTRPPLLALLLSGLATAIAAGPTIAAAEDLPITQVPADKFPVLKTKVFNSNFGLYGAAGNAVIRSHYSTDESTDGQRVFIYSYQLDLTAAYDVIGHPGVSAVTLDLPKMPDLNTSPKLPSGAKVYVITETGSANKGIDVQSASADNGKITFTFATPIHAGKKSGTGTHSQWFGLVSTTVASRGDAILTTLPLPKTNATVPINPQPSPQTATTQNPTTELSIAEPKPVDPTVTPPLNVFVPVTPPAVPPAVVPPAVAK
jgi:hypothetical protein